MADDRRFARQFGDGDCGIPAEQEPRGRGRARGSGGGGRGRAAPANRRGEAEEDNGSDSGDGRRRRKVPCNRTWPPSITYARCLVALSPEEQQKLANGLARPRPAFAPDESLIASLYSIVQVAEHSTQQRTSSGPDVTQFDAASLAYAEELDDFAQSDDGFPMEVDRDPAQ